MYSAIQVANYIAATAHVSPRWEKTKLLKLVYYAQAWHFAWTGRPLFAEKVEAWPMGPVVYDVWNNATQVAPSTDGITAEDSRLIDDVLRTYGRMSGTALSELTHHDAAWLDARKGLTAEEHSNNEISPEAMSSCYLEQIIDGKDVPLRSVPLDDGPRGRVTTAESIDAARTRWRQALDDLAHL